MRFAELCEAGRASSMNEDTACAGNQFSVLVVTAIDHSFEVLYTVEGTHYGRVLFVFQVSGSELAKFRDYAQRTLTCGYEIKILLVMAENLERVHVELDKLNLLPAGQSRVAVEGTSFFDEVIAQLITGTIWADKELR